MFFKELNILYHLNILKIPFNSNTISLLTIRSSIDTNLDQLNQDIINPIDRHYDQLDCKLKAIESNDYMFNIIDKY